jgi:DNA-binding PadR family transcriptional regulator
MFRYLVLGLLRSGGSFHGYAFMKEYRERSGLQLSTGNFYRELQRLVGEGFVRTVANPADADPRRAPYAITEAGSVAFDAWLSEPPGAGVGRYEDELSSRALFLENADPAVVRASLTAWKEELWIRSKMDERARSAARAQRPNEAVRLFSPLPLLFARSLKHIAADLEFLDELAEAYERWVVSARPVMRKRPGVTSAASKRSRRRESPD